MARVSIPVTPLTRAGVAPPAQINADATNKNALASNNGRTLLEIVSSDAGSQTVTLEIDETVDGVANPGKVVTIPAGATRLVGPFPTGIYNQADGTVYVDPSVSTTLKFRAYSL